MALLSVLNGILARFQNWALASAVVAMPVSPMPPARASGEMRRKGTEVVTTLRGSGDWAIAPAASSDPKVRPRKYLCNIYCWIKDVSQLAAYHDLFLVYFVVRYDDEGIDA